MNATATKVGLLEALERRRRTPASNEGPALTCRSAELMDLPLSYVQEGMWFQEQLQPGGPAYNMSAAVRLEGVLDRAALGRSFGELVRRHEALRTVFVTVDGQPRQRVLPAPADYVVSVTPVPGDTRETRETAARAWATAEAARGFDLAVGPPLRVQMLALDATTHVLVVTLHHIVGDGWSVGVLLRELAAVYAAFRDGQPSPLAAPALQYGDYAVWQRQWLTPAELTRQVAYWQQQLAGAPALLELPLDAPRPATHQWQGASVRVTVPAGTTAALRQLARREEATMFMTLLAAYQTLLHLYTGQTDLVVGTDDANRQRTETADLVGLFVNQLAIRVRLHGRLTFRELLRRVRHTTIEAFAHAAAPFERVVDALPRMRHSTTTPIFQTKFVMAAGPAVDDWRLPELLVERLAGEERTAKFDVTLFAQDLGDAIAFSLNYDRTIISKRSALAMADHLHAILTKVTDQADVSIGQLRSDLAPAARSATPRPSLRSMKPSTVSLVHTDAVSIVPIGLMPGAPAMVEPRQIGVALLEWARQQRPVLEETVARHGGVLLRGFGAVDATEFQAFAELMCGTLYQENGEHPRENVSGSVYTPIFYPHQERLLWHNENSFDYRWPAKILFHCVTAPTRGGETTLADSRLLFSRLPDEVRQPLLDRGVMYRRAYNTGLGLDWQTVFQTTSRADVERRCREAHVGCEWNGDSLRTTMVRPAAIAHPQTGEYCWFNQAQHWHTACLPAATRESLQDVCRNGWLPRECYYGDGGAIPDDHMTAILAVYAELERATPWRSGDVMLVDNILMAHGRNPFEGQRKLLVAMGDMRTYGEVRPARA